MKNSLPELQMYRLQGQSPALSSETEISEY